MFHQSVAKLMFLMMLLTLLRSFSVYRSKKNSSKFSTKSFFFKSSEPDSFLSHLQANMSITLSSKSASDMSAMEQKSQVRLGLVRLDKVSSGQVMSGQLRLGKARSADFPTKKKCIFYSFLGSFFNFSDCQNKTYFMPNWELNHLFFGVEAEKGLLLELQLSEVRLGQVRFRLIRLG